jgi:hypothetical protein
LRGRSGRHRESTRRQGGLHGLNRLRRRREQARGVTADDLLRHAVLEDLKVLAVRPLTGFPFLSRTTTSTSTAAVDVPNFGRCDGA